MKITWRTRRAAKKAFIAQTIAIIGEEQPEMTELMSRMPEEKEIASGKQRLEHLLHHLRIGLKSNSDEY